MESYLLLLKSHCYHWHLLGIYYKSSYLFLVWLLWIFSAAWNFASLCLFFWFVYFALCQHSLVTFSLKQLSSLGAQSFFINSKKCNFTEVDLCIFWPVFKSNQTPFLDSRSLPFLFALFHCMHINISFPLLPSIPQHEAKPCTVNIIQGEDNNKKNHFFFSAQLKTLKGVGCLQSYNHWQLFAFN